MLLGVAAGVQAQVLKQLPANPWVVIKFNNPQNISTKFAAMAQKLGLTNLDPAFADPLGALKKQFNVQGGIDEKGEVAIAIYAPADNEPEPRYITLVPVTDYAAFLKSLPNVKTTGDVSTFTLPDDDDEIYAVKWGSYAALTLYKDLLAQKPTGIEVAGLAAKQLASNDVTAFVNVKAISTQVLPMLQANRTEIIQELDRELAAAGPNGQKFAPAIKTLVNQALEFAEKTLKEGQAATLGIMLVDQGINITGMGEFDPAGSIGQTIASIKNSSDASFLAGLPSRQYFVFGGAALDPAVSRKIFNDAVSPIRKELANVQDAKGIVAMIDAAQSSVEATKSVSFGWVVPAEGQKSIIQQVNVCNGDAKKLQQAQRSYFASLTDVMKLIPEAPEAKVQVTPEAKVVEDAKLDQVSVQFKFDTNTPEGAQAAQAFSMMYGQEGISGVMGPVNDETFVSVFGGDDELIKATVAAARKHENPLSQRPNIKAVADQLPKSRVAVFYVAIDNIVNEVTKFMAQMGMAVPLKFPADMQPIGVAVSTEGAAVRADTHLSTELLGNLISAGIQATQMMQPGGVPKPGAP
jgi:hypothetical protein